MTGKGLKGLHPLSGVSNLDMGNSGTSMRLLLGVLAGQKMEMTLSGDESLSSRPMKRVTDPLKKMGAQIKGRDNGNLAPLTIRGGRLKGIDYVNQLASAQVKSAILFAGLNAEGSTTIREELKSRDHTERLLEICGADIQRNDHGVSVSATASLRPLDLEIPGDISSAAFFIAGAAMIPGSRVEIDGVGLNPTRTGLIKVLKKMGAKIEVQETVSHPEPIGSLIIKGARLHGTRIKKEETPFLIDELPILMVAMALAEGESLISGASELRVKETDRIASMVSNLKSIGADIEELPDGCVIRGQETLAGGSGKSFGDHRTAMSLAIASLGCRQEVEIDDVACVATSYPAFFKHYKGLRKLA